MKVLFLTRSYYPNIGGVEKHVEKIADELLKKGYDVTVITEKPITSYSKNYQSRDVTARLVGNKNLKIYEIEVGSNDWFKKFRIWFQLLRLLKLFKNADVVHAHDVYFWYFPFRLIFLTKKSFVTFHGYEGNKIPNLRAKLMHKLSEKLSKGNICIGEFLEKWYGTKASFVSYGAVETRHFLKSSSKVLAANKGVFIGRLENETGVLEYLKAIKFLKDRKVNISLDIFGDGSQLIRANKYVEENNLNVKFNGFVKDVEVFLPNYKFAFVSRYLGIIESLYYKVEVFSIYNNQIKKDYLSMTPFANYIRIAADPEEIVKHFVEDRGNSKNLDQGHRWAKEQTWGNLADVYIKLWNIK